MFYVVREDPIREEKASWERKGRQKLKRGRINKNRGLKFENGLEFFPLREEKNTTFLELFVTVKFVNVHALISECEEEYMVN